MSRILVPYHLDEHRPDLGIPLRADATVAPALPAGDVWVRLAALYDRVAGEVAGVVRAGERPVVASGDCTTALGTVAGLQRAGVEPSIVWFDAHGDVQTMETTASGYLGGYPLRILVGYRPELISTRLGLYPVAEGEVVLVDARDLDPPEVEYLRGSAITHTPVTGLDPDLLPRGPIYLHLDLDVIDAAEVPGLLYPAPGGPSAGAVAGAARSVLDSGRVAAVGLGCTWHPGHDSAERVEPMLRALDLAG